CVPRLRCAGTLLTLLLALPCAAKEFPAPPPDRGNSQAAPQATAAADKAAPDAAPPGLLESTLSLDISTASFNELVDWLRSLGLDDSGTIEGLRSRLYSHFKVSPAAPKAAASRVVTIESANRLEYGKTDPQGGGDIVSLTGGVKLSIKDAASTDAYVISAHDIVYDRGRNAVFASGNVTYSRSSKGRVEEFRGSTLAADLDDWSGLFLDGIWRRDGAGLATGDRGLSFAAATMDKSSGDYLSLTNATIGPTGREDPAFSLRAGKLWFLGGGDWAAMSALLYVGEVPMIWLPFFYYPSEEIVFHPYFGYREREGSFLQTTWYLAGAKPPAENSTAILKLATETGPTQPRGLFLKKAPASGAGATSSYAASTSASAQAAAAGADTSSQPSTLIWGLPLPTMAKVYADAYSSLGAFTGLDATFPSFGPVSRLDFSSGLGVSRSIFSGSLVSSGASSPFPDGATTSLWNFTTILGIPLPLRYGLSLTTSLSFNPMTLSLEVPAYSDPFFEQDFRDRGEDQDWLGLSQQSAVIKTPPAKRSSFAQKFSLSGSPKIPFLSPWLSSVTPRWASSFAWNAKPDSDLRATYVSTNLTNLYNYDPAREFFYPSSLRLADFSLNLSGSLYDSAGLPAGSPAAMAKAPMTATGKALELRAPWDSSALPKDDRATTVARSFTPPPLAVDFGGLQGASGAFARVSWSVQPGLSLERRFPETWAGLSEIDFGSKLYDLSSWRLGSALNSTFALPANVVSGSASFNYSDQGQVRDAPVDTNSTYARLDAQFPRRRVSGSLRLTSQPLPASNSFGASSLAWTMDSLLYSKAFASFVDASNYRDPANYKEIYPFGGGDWKDIITAHTASATLSHKLGSWQQSLVISSTLPPQAESYSASLSLGAGILGWTAGLSAQERISRKDAVVTWTPFSASIRMATPFGLSLSDSGSWDVEHNWATSNSASLSWGAAQASLSWQRTLPLDLVKVGDSLQWQTSTTEAFIPATVALSFAPRYAPADLGDYKPNLGATFSFSQNLQRFTDSMLSIGLNANLAIGSGFTLSFATSSQNRSTWRYWPKLFPATAKLLTDPSINPFVDLAKSLAVWDFSSKGLLHQGNFKMKNLSFRMTQDLVDWGLSADATATPKLDPVNKVYIIDPSFHFSVTWKDIPALKTAIAYQNSILSW
ncbi:MAG: hypothetical protein WCQ50_14505, partial [Spirochaetota bacterium]